MVYDAKKLSISYSINSVLTGMFGLWIGPMETKRIHEYYHVLDPNLLAECTELNYFLKEFMSFGVQLSA